MACNLVAYGRHRPMHDTITLCRRMPFHRIFIRPRPEQLTMFAALNEVVRRDDVHNWRVTARADTR
jgi:hypothetical protein